MNSYNKLRAAVAAALAVLVFSLTAGIAQANTIPNTLTSVQAASHIGTRAVVIGTVARVSAGKNGDILLDIDGIYPYQKLVIVITPKAQINTEEASAFLGKTLGFQGKIRCRTTGAISPVIRITNKSYIIESAQN